MTGETSALQLVLTGDPGLYAIVGLSLVVSLSAVLCAALIGSLPLVVLYAFFVEHYVSAMTGAVKE